MHARGSGEAARRANDPSRAISNACGHLRVLRFARRTTEKTETAPSLYLNVLFSSSSSSSLILQSVILLPRSCIVQYLFIQLSKTNLILCTPICFVDRGG